MVIVTSARRKMWGYYALCSDANMMALWTLRNLVCAVRTLLHLLSGCQVCHEAFSTICAVHIEYCEGWWLSDCYGSVAEHWWLKQEMSFVHLLPTAGLSTSSMFLPKCPVWDKMLGVSLNNMLYWNYRMRKRITLFIALHLYWYIYEPLWFIHLHGQPVGMHLTISYWGL